MAEANRQSAHDALEASRRHLGNGNLDGAIRLCKKAISCDDSLQAAHSFLKELEALAREGAVPPATTPASTPPLAPQASTSTARPRPTKTESTGGERPFTTKQVAMIKRVRACRRDAYYEILEVERTCDDLTIKKAFRKMVLHLHPDKCGHPDADETFKIVAKAAEVLGDADKRAHYDRHGTDPDDRRAQAAASGFGGPGMGMRRGPGMQSFGEEINPEDLFNMFFGGGFGGPGVRMQTFGGGPTFMFGNTFPQRPRGNGDRQQAPAWLQMLPLLLLTGLSLLSYIPSLFTAPPPKLPSYRFSPLAPYNLPQETHLHNVEYFVDPVSFSNSHLFHSVLDLNPDLAKLQPVEALASKSLSSVKMPNELKHFEKQVEASFVDYASEQCRQESNEKQRRLERARGFFGFGQDLEELKRIHSTPMPGCDNLRRMGYRLT